MEPDADEDYMGDLSRFLPPSPFSSPPKNLGRRKQPSTQAQAQPRAKREKGVAWQERRRQELCMFVLLSSSYRHTKH
jgi:hypothetical protein